MAEGERQDKRPSCGWPIIETNAGGGTSAHPCGSEQNVFNVKGRGKYVGRARETPVCEKHLLDAWKSWNVDSAEPLCGSGQQSAFSTLFDEFGRTQAAVQRFVHDMLRTARILAK
jgi:hypothetical protein